MTHDIRLTTIISVHPVQFRDAMSPNDTAPGPAPGLDTPATEAEKHTNPTATRKSQEITSSGISNLTTQPEILADDKKLPISESDGVDGEDTESEPGRGRSPHDQGEGDPENPTRLPSHRRSSSFARSALVVPRGERRGLLGRFAIIPEVENPYDYNRNTKVRI